MKPRLTIAMPFALGLLLPFALAQAEPPRKVASKWAWEWVLKDDSTGKGVLTLFEDGTCELPSVNLKGKWTSKASAYTIDWGRGKGNEDALLLSPDGKTLAGSNPFAKSIKGTRLVE